MMNNKLKTILLLLPVLFLLSNEAKSQCGFLSGNNTEVFSSSSTCAPVSVSWNIQYSFIAAVNPARVLFRFEWNDPANTITDVQGACSGFDCFPASGTQNFTYPAGSTNCEYAPKVTVAWDANSNGTIETSELCSGSSITKSVRSWSTDASGTGNLSVSPSFTEQCVGEALLGFQIQDMTIPNCNSSSLSNPNQLTRWVQFVYGDPGQSAPQIPNAIVDAGGTLIPVTDASGNLISPYFGPVVEIPAVFTQSDLNEISYPVNFGANNTIGEKFKIYLRSWNICNPYDQIPFDGLPPNDPINGDFAPETTFSEIEIIGPTVSQAGIDQEICGNSTFLSANSALVGSGSWQQISGPGTLNINNPNSESSAINFTGNNYGTYQMEWVINYKGCISRDTVEIIFNPDPTIPVCGPDQAICGLSTNLSANTINIGTGYWVQVAGSTGLSISDTLDRLSLITANTYGVYELEWRSRNANCPEISDLIEITFYEEPSTANAGADLNVCGNTTTLNAFSPIVGNGIWSTISSPTSSNPVFGNIGSAFSTFNSDSFGTYLLKWTTSNGVCPSKSDTVQVLFNEPPSNSNAGLNMDICGLTASLNANSPSAGIGKWVFINGPGNAVFNDTLNPQSFLIVSAFGSYIFEWQISNSNCPVSTDQVQITFFNNPDTANAGIDQQICGNSTILNASSISLGNGVWTLVNSPSGSNPVITNPSSRNSTFLTDSFGVYNLLWLVSNGVCPVNQDTVQIEFFESPGIPVVGPDQVICGLSANLLANSPNAGIGQWVQISGPSGLVINSPNDPTSSISATNYGTYVLAWQFINATCPIVNDQVQITFDAVPSQALAGSDTSICGTNTMLNADLLSIGNGQWSVINSPTGSNPIISNIANAKSSLSIDSFGIYTLRWTSSNGACPSSNDNVRIIFNEKPDFSVANQSSTSCFGLCDGSVSLSGTKGLAPYFYTWLGADEREGNNLTDLCGGNYQVTISDKNGCQASKNVLVNEADSISGIVSVSSATCGNFDGSINLSAFGGTGNLSFQWNTGALTQNISNIPSGLYVATVKDQNNCFELLTAVVNDIGGPSLGINNIAPATCKGASDGAIDLAVSGQNNTYLWSNGADTEDLVNLQAGPYYVAAEDTTNNCKTFLKVDVPEPSEINIQVNITKPTCGQSDGTASVTVLGGNGSNTINWSTGNTGTSVSGLSAGVYNVTVTDFKGCSKNKTFAISDKGAPLIFTDSVRNVTCANNNGAIFISTTGNSGLYTYQWSSGDTTEDITNLNVGTYNLEVTDTLGCKSFYTQGIIQVTEVNPEICMVSVGTLDSGASDNYNTVLWSKLTDPDAYDEFRIYRETTSAGLYQQLGSVSAKNPGIFVDSISNSLLKSYRYKISVVDTCGIESELSDYHKTIHLVQFPGLQPNTINLLWDDYEGFAYGTYYLYRNSQANGWELIDSLSSNNNSYTDTFNLNDPDLFYAIEINSPRDCDPDKGEDYTRSRSNRSSTLFSPPALGLETEFSENDFVIYPVPVVDIICIRSNLKGLLKVRVMDINGKIRYSGNIDNDFRNIDLSQLSSGFYFIEISNSTGIFRKSILKK